MRCGARLQDLRRIQIPTVQSKKPCRHLSAGLLPLVSRREPESNWSNRVCNPFISFAINNLHQNHTKPPKTAATLKLALAYLTRSLFAIPIGETMHSKRETAYQRLRLLNSLLAVNSFQLVEG